MNDFKVECFIEYNNGQYTELSKSDQKEIEQWKKDLEIRALKEYYDTEIKISKKNV